MPRNCYFTRFVGMFVLPVAPFLAYQPPSVAFHKVDDVTDLHLCKRLMCRINIVLMLQPRLA